MKYMLLIYNEEKAKGSEKEREGHEQGRGAGEEQGPQRQLREPRDHRATSWT